MADKTSQTRLQEPFNSSSYDEVVLPSAPNLELSLEKPLSALPWQLLHINKPVIFPIIHQSQGNFSFDSLYLEACMVIGV